MVIDFDTRIPQSFLKYCQVCYGNMLIMIRFCIKIVDIWIRFEKVFILNKHEQRKYVLGLKRKNIQFFK